MKHALLALLLLTSSARSQDEASSAPEGQAVEEDRTAAISDLKKKFESDPGLLEALVDRVLQTKIANAISSESDSTKKRNQVREYLNHDLGSAAEIAMGLQRDEDSGTKLFENTVTRHLRQTFRRGNTTGGAFGVLKGAAKTSKQMGKPENEAGDDERREIMRNMFDGLGSQGERTITGSAPEGKAASDTPAPSAGFANSFYDRLSAGNIRGYSPQLMAFQSALNQRRPPGAPKLIETGKLDFATLSFPSFGLAYDLQNLDDRFRRARIAELATLAGVRLTERDMKDPGLEARLLAKVPMGKLKPRFASRSDANMRAAAAVVTFQLAAAKSKDPNQITKGLLLELAGKQREASRWLTVAALEEELARIESEEGFMTADLLAAIDAVPAPAPVRESYKRRGEGYAARLTKLKANAQGALDALQSDAWLSRIGEIEKMLSENSGLRRNISRDVSDYRLVPFRVGEAVLKQPRWREIVDNLLVRYAKSTSYGREVANRRGKLARFLSIFGQIASGDTNGSHLALVNAEGGRR